MANSVCEVLLTATGLETPPEDVDPGAGAVVDFRGVVRSLEAGREITGIEYEAHPSMAKHQLEAVAAEAMAKFQLRKVVMHHRIGFVGAGEPSLFLRVKAGHREAAFSAGKWIVDELKKRVPIWKHPQFTPAASLTTASSNQRAQPAAIQS